MAFNKVDLPTPLTPTIPILSFSLIVKIPYLKLFYLNI